jgi:sugar-specific transcriptional regulator TrmB
MVLEKYLQEIGLADKEASVYLSLLQVDNASVLDIAKKTKINRTTIYFVLESLEKKGLVSEIQQGKKTYFAAEPPERLETYIERQKTVLDEHSRRLKDMLPEIKAVQRELGERPVVKYFEGKEGAYNSSHFFFADVKGKTNNGDGYFVFNRDLIEDVFTEREIADTQKIRPSKQIKGKSIYVYSKGNLPSNEITERKKLDGERYPIRCDVSVYGDRVQFVTLGKKVSSIFIQSRDVADTMKTLFKLAFESLK